MRSNTGETVKPRTKEANLPAENDHSDKAVQPETSMLVEQVKRLPFRPEAQELLEDEPRNPECYRWNKEWKILLRLLLLNKLVIMLDQMKEEIPPSAFE